MRITAMMLCLVLWGCGTEEEPPTFCEEFAEAFCEERVCAIGVQFDECYPRLVGDCLYTREISDRDECAAALEEGADWCVVGLPNACH